MRVTKPSGESFELQTKHSLSRAHLDWIRAGSALNLIREQAQRTPSSAPRSAAPAGARAMSTFAGARRGYATAASAGASRLNPNDPRYVAPAADGRTDSIRRAVYPAVATTRAEAQAAAAEALHKALPYPAEVHETITRAWLLHRREQRLAQAADLAAKRQRMEEACADLKSTSPTLFKAAAYRVAPNRRHPDEQARLVRLGLAPAQAGQGAKGDAPIAGPEARRRAKTLAGARLHGLFPRELRAPTQTPSRKGWPSYEAFKEDQA